MTTKYKYGDHVPNEVLATRLDELADAVIARMKNDPAPMDREFTCRIPAEMDRDADLVLSEAARRLRQLEYTVRVPVPKSTDLTKQLINAISTAGADDLSEDELLAQGIHFGNYEAGFGKAVEIISRRVRDIFKAAQGEG